jgi:hypothetical protein
VCFGVTSLNRGADGQRSWQVKHLVERRRRCDVRAVACSGLQWNREYPFATC